MTRLTDAELRIALDRQDWNTLWFAAEPWIRFAMAELGCGDEDALQEGRLAAGLAVRSWDPDRHAFSTHITSRVRFALLKYFGENTTGGIGSSYQAADGKQPRFISLDAPAAQPSGTFNPDGHKGTRALLVDNLTYEEFDDSTPFERLLASADAAGELSAELLSLPAEDAEFVREVLSAGSVRALCRLTGEPRRSLDVRLAKIVQRLSAHYRETCYIQWSPSNNFGQSGSNPERFVGVGSGNPYADWSWKPTPEDVKNGAEPRQTGYPWSAGAKKLMGLLSRKRGR